MKYSTERIKLFQICEAVVKVTAVDKQKRQINEIQTHKN